MKQHTSKYADFLVKININKNVKSLTYRIVKDCVSLFRYLKKFN